MSKKRENPLLTFFSHNNDYDPLIIRNPGSENVKMYRISHIFLSVMAASALAVPTAQAQEFEHVHLDRSDSVQFADLLPLAIENSPRYRELAARNAEASAHQAVGDSWIAGNPSLSVDYLDDRSLSNLGQTELTWGVELPLWRLGEKQQMAALGERYGEQSTAWKQALELDIAGQLRIALADLNEADTLIVLEQEATGNAQALLDIVERLFTAGEVAQLEVMQARSLLLNQQRNELQANAARVDAERQYHILTGLEVAPATAHSESRVENETIPTSHPVLDLLQADIDLQAANVLKVKAAAKGNPSLTLGSRRQKDAPGAGYSNALALSVKIPLGGSTFVNASTANAERAKVEAEVQYYTALRELNAKLHEAEYQLFTVESALPMMEEEARLASQQWEMARTAFELGEIDMSQVVIALQLARNSAKDFETLALRQQRLILQYNQIIGVLP